MARPIGPDIKIRLMEKTQKDTNGCLIFSGASRRGYGLIWKDGKNVLAHREAFKIFCGQLADNEVVCHRCDVPLCINPEHLFKGERADNNKDMRDKLRHAFGEKNGQSKFSEAEVFFIKSSDESSTKLASMFSVNQSTIWRIRNGKRWKHTLA